MKFILILAVITLISPYNALGDNLERRTSYQLEDERLTTRQIEALELKLEIVQESTKDLIIRLSTENDFNVQTALRIAECESQYGKYKFNWEGSSAKGIYQFTNRTWNNYCEGDVLNDYDNIMCFLKLYQKHSNWWSCR